LAIVTLVLWVITAAAGVSLLRTGGAARRLAAETVRAEADSEQGPAGPVRAAADGASVTVRTVAMAAGTSAAASTASTAASATSTAASATSTAASATSTAASATSTAASATSTAASAASAAAGPARPAGPPARYGAIPRTADGKPPPVPKVKVATPPGEHPLLEFSHPALAVTGLAFWFGFTFVHYRPFAWVSLAILVVAIGLGLSWLIRNAQAVRRQARAAWRFPRQLVVLHGLAAAIGISLTVLTALSASHG
jgi:cobalamin biosynthesis Mg chelatase CobN